jgi:hypothetical protein
VSDAKAVSTAAQLLPTIKSLPAIDDPVLLQHIVMIELRGGQA